MRRIKCCKCDGKGEIPLPAHLERTLSAVGSGLKTTEQIYRRDPDRKKISRNAINNRLNDLLELGLITRYRLGKFITYSEAK